MSQAVVALSSKRILSEFVQNDGQLVFRGTVEITEALCTALEEHKTFFQNIKLLRVRGCLVSRLLQVILSEESRCSRLAMFHSMPSEMDDNDNTGSMRILSTSLASSASKLRYLEITTAFATSDDSKEETTAVSLFAEGLSQNRCLKVLRLEDCFLEDAQVASIVTALRVHPCLQKLWLSGNKCGSASSTALSNLLQEPECKLQFLYLDMTSIRSSQRNRSKLNIQELATALRHNRSIHTLDLTSNMINDEDLGLLGRTMIPPSSDTAETMFNSTLTCLDLGRNCITDAGLSTLLYQILPQVRGKLRTLALWGNLMEDLSSTAADNMQGGNHPKILKNRVIKAMLDLEDVELLRAVSLPEQIPVGMWPQLLRRLQRAMRAKPEALGCNRKPVDLLYLVVRGPMLSALGRRKSGSSAPPGTFVNGSPAEAEGSAVQEKEPTWKISTRLLVKECAENPNPYLREFASSPLADIMLKDDRVASCFCRRNRSSIRKELVEAAALESRLKRVYKVKMDDTKTVIWDLCAGKGYSAVWLSANTFPNAQIHMVDIDSKANRSFLVAFPNITYHNLDLYSSELEDLIVKSVQETKGDRVILAGIHLCKSCMWIKALEIFSFPFTTVPRTHLILIVFCCCCCVSQVGTYHAEFLNYNHNVERMPLF